MLGVSSCSLSDLEEVLAPVRALYGEDLNPLDCVEAIVQDVELLRAEADRLAQVENFVRGVT